MSNAIIQHNPKFSAAYAFAEKKHNGQKRRNGEPYITHPEAVFMALYEAGERDEAILCASLLHDCVEDTAKSQEEAAAVKNEIILLFADMEPNKDRKFGETVAQYVDELTVPHWSFQNHPHKREQRKLWQLLKAKEMSLPTRKIKLADRLCNMRDDNQRIKTFSPYMKEANALTRQIGEYSSHGMMLTLALTSKPAESSKDQSILDKLRMMIDAEFYAFPPQMPARKTLISHLKGRQPLPSAAHL